MMAQLVNFILTQRVPKSCIAWHIDTGGCKTPPRRGQLESIITFSVNWAASPDTCCTQISISTPRTKHCLLELFNYAFVKQMLLIVSQVDQNTQQLICANNNKHFNSLAKPGLHLRGLWLCLCVKSPYWKKSVHLVITFPCIFSLVVYFRTMQIQIFFVFLRQLSIILPQMKVTSLDVNVLYFAILNVQF